MHFNYLANHLSCQTKFAYLNLLYIINGEVIEFTKWKMKVDNFQSLS